MNKQLRNYLMNSSDLGLTREEIKKEVREVVREEFQKYLKSGELEPLLYNTFVNNPRNNIRWEVINRAGELVSQHLIKLLRITENDSRKTGV